MRPQWLEELQDKTFEKLKYRNLDGTFAKGNPGGPGRPRVNFLARAGIVRLVPLEEMSPEVRDISLRAEHGDYRALSFLKRILNKNCPSANIENSSQDQK